MRHLILAMLLTLSAVALNSGCTEPSTAGSTRYVDGMRKLPALPWLDANKNTYALASNRFGQTANAREFVSELLRLGAEQVYVANPMDEARRIETEGGPYADTLIVTLPTDKAKRAALFRVFAAEAKREGFDPEPDRNQKDVLLWWD